MKALFENIDLFAHKISFYYEKKNLFHSFFGIGLSFIVYGIIIFFVHYFSKDFVNKANPRVIYQETEFADKLTFRLDQIINSKMTCILSFYSSEVLFNMTEKYKPIQIPSEDLIDIFLEHFSSIDYKKQLLTFKTKATLEIKNFLDNPNACWKSSKCYNYNVAIETQENFTVHYSNKKYTWDFTDYVLNNKTGNFAKFKDANLTLTAKDYLSFGIKPGKNFISLMNSKNIYNLFLFHTINLKNSIIDANNDTFFKSHDIPANLNAKIDNSTKKIEVELTKSNYGVVSLKDDKGFILSDIEDKYEIRFSNEYKEMKTVNLKSNQRITFYSIRMDVLLKHYDRIYKKLQNVFADLGGIFNSLVLIGNIIIVSFNKNKFDYDLINKVFKVEEDIDNKIGKEKDFNALKVRQVLINNNSSNIEMNSSRSFVKKLSDNNSKAKEQNNYLKHSNNFSEKQIGITQNLKEVESEKRLVDLKRENKNSQNIMRIDDKKIQREEAEGVEKSMNQKEEVNKEHEKNETKAFLDKFQKDELFKKPLKMTKLDFFTTFLCCNKLKNNRLLEIEEIFQQAQSEIYEYMDVINYVLLFEKINKLISIIFNESQALSFNFIRNRRIDEIISQRLNEENVRKVIDYYCYEKNKTEMTSLDIKILNSFYSSFKKLIKNN